MVHDFFFSFFLFVHDFKKCVIELGVQGFYWEFSCLCLLKRLAHNSLFWLCPCPVLEWVWYWLQKMSW
jgi:hypothetical protein